MYLKEIYLENTGPISKCHVELPFNEENPLPVVVVGPNGSGKSIFLSYIVDALTEFAKASFSNLVPDFRTVNQHAIRSGEQFSLSLLRFETTDWESLYCEKVGALDPSNYPPDFESRFGSVWGCLDEKDDKYLSIDKDIVKSEMEENAHAFFPARRYETQIGKIPTVWKKACVLQLWILICNLTNLYRLKPAQIKIFPGS